MQWEERTCVSKMWVSVCVFKPPRGFNFVHYCLSFCWHFSSLNQSDIPCYLIQKCDYLQHKNSSWGQLGERSFFFRFCFSPFQDSALTQFSVSSLVPIVFTNFFFLSHFIAGCSDILNHISTARSLLDILGNGDSLSVSVCVCACVCLSQ